MLMHPHPITLFDAVLYELNLANSHCLSQVEKLRWRISKGNLEFQFRSVKCTVVTRFIKNFEQLSIPI